MKKYKFKILQLMSVWEEREIEVLATNLKDAVYKLNNCDAYEYEDSELIVDTIEPIIGNEKERFEVYYNDDYRELDFLIEDDDESLSEELNKLEDKEKDSADIINYIRTRL